MLVLDLDFTNEAQALRIVLAARKWAKQANSLEQFISKLKNIK
jgi:hypothetical protein